MFFDNPEPPTEISLAVRKEANMSDTEMTDSMSLDIYFDYL